MGGTRRSSIVSSAADVLGMRRVGGVCEMCMCFARVGVGGEGRVDKTIRFGLYQSCGEQGECWTCVCVAVVWVGGLNQGMDGWGGIMPVCVVSPDSLCRWQVQVSVYCARRIAAHLRCTQCSIMLHLIDI